MFWYVRGHVGEGRRWLEQALALGTEAPSARRIEALVGAGTFAHYQGDDARAAAYVERSLTLSRALGDRRGMAFSLLLLGIVAEDRGDYDATALRLDEARATFAGLADLNYASLAVYHLAVVAYGQGDLARADALGEEALGAARAAADAFSIAAALAHLGLLAGDHGEVRWASAALTEGLALYRASKDLEGIARCLASFALLAAADRRWAQATRLFGAVATLQADLGYGFRFPERPRYDRAVEALGAELGEAAFAAAHAAGRALPIEEAIGEARALAAALTEASSTSAVPAQARFGLSPRELEVLRLLVEGRSDKEIGAALSISHRTVMFHVSRILGKLGADSRTAVATFAIRHCLV